MRTPPRTDRVPTAGAGDAAAATGAAAAHHDAASPAAVAPPTRGGPGGRLAALDRFRGAALVAMLLHHLCEWLAGDARKVLPGWPDFTLTDVSAPAFFVAAGASCALLVASRRRRRLPALRIAGVVLRRYGLLIPIGMALEWALWGNPFAFGVLEAIGVTVVVGALLAALLPGELLSLAAVAALTFGVMVERDVTGRPGWLAVELLGGNFPVITYLGFVLVGMAVVRSGRYGDRRWVLSAAVMGVAAVVLMLLEGIVPARYPGDIGLVVPGLAGSALVYALCQARWPAALDAVDRVLRAAATHTFGIFVGHYAIYWVLRETGVARSVSDLVTIPAAVVTTVLLCLVAPRVPQPPWSLRTGWRRPRAPAGGAPPADTPAGAMAVSAASASR